MRVELFTTQSRLLTTLKQKPFENIWKNVKMLVTSILSFSHNVFYPSQNKALFLIYIYFVICNCFEFGPVLTLPKQALVFTCLQYKPFENTVGKGEIARNEQFLLFQLCFLPFLRTFCHFHGI